MSELVVRGLAKSYGAVQVLRGVDLRVAGGSLASVLGPSGCGKTTLLRVLAGFEHADAGEVVVGDRRVVAAADGVHLPPERRRVGVVPQEGALFPHLSVGENVAYGLRQGRTGWTRGGAGDRARRTTEVLELVGLAGLADRMPHELSGGQQQRVAVARALAPRPSLVLLDEPFSALDAGLRAEVRATVRDALRTDGATAVLVTHDQEEALSMSDVVAVMRDGRIVQAAAPLALYSQPADLAVADFLGEAVVLPGVRAGGSVRTVLGALPVREGATGVQGPVAVLVRPEQIELDRAPVRADLPTGTVVAETFFGHDALVTVELDGGHTVEARSLRGGEVRVGEHVGVRVVGRVSCYSR